MGNDLRFALRMILSHRWFSAAVVATLALGIGLNTMIFTLVNGALFKPVPVPGGARLVSILNRNLSRGEDVMRVSYPDFRDYRAQASGFEAIEAASDGNGVLCEGVNQPQTYRLERASSGIFQMLHIRPILGRDFIPADDQAGAEPVLLIGYAIWRDRYGSSPIVIGRQVRVDAKPATIIGVMPEGFQFTTTVDMWMAPPPTPDLEKRTGRQLELFGILKPGITREHGSVELNSIAHRLAIQYPRHQ